MFGGWDNAGILFSQRPGGGGAAALGTTGKRACVPAGSDDREHARGDGARGSGAAGWVEPVGWPTSGITAMKRMALRDYVTGRARVDSHGLTPRRVRGSRNGLSL